MICYSGISFSIRRFIKYRLLISQNINYWPNSGQIDSSRIGCISFLIFFSPPSQPFQASPSFCDVETRYLWQTSCRGYQCFKRCGTSTETVPWQMPNINRSSPKSRRQYWRWSTHPTKSPRPPSDPQSSYRPRMWYTGSPSRSITVYITTFLCCVLKIDIDNDVKLVFLSSPSLKP